MVGIPDAEAGELPRAYVVVKPGNTLTEHEVKQLVAGDTIVFFIDYIESY